LEDKQMDVSQAYVDAFFAGCDKISLLELVKIQAKVLVPLVRALRKELGTERANQIVAEALRGWSRELYGKIGQEMHGRPTEKFDAMLQAWMPKIGGDVDFETLRQTPEHFDFNITGCRYADFFRQLGEPELGALLLCESDFHVTELIGSPDVKLERTQTIMKGAKYCDFRWRMNQGGSVSE
jgi:L-2-amino-thiazoline-4-carboxylic acid hydrolase-like protein